jgi:CO/xanthine dehydrogenase Mo-binding subunit/aerobic-type carbon monoxide dehydrogenase small subunit (CoxS/CutS family)
MLDTQTNLRCWVNDEPCEVAVGPGEMLSDVLRERLGLTGTKIGCNEAECGICTVLLDGAPVLSCSLPALKANGKHVLTVEGLARDGRLHPLQEAFVEYGAVQCGFCIPGQLMMGAALLAKNTDPSEDDIRAAFKDTLCRCGTYLAMMRAIKSAGHKLRTGEGLPPPDLTSPSEAGVSHRVVGHAHPRPDGIAKVTGAARFTDDYTFPHMLHARVLRAGMPHAILRSLDVAAARALPGVQAVLTAEDVPGRNAHGLVIFDWPVLIGVGEKVRTVGDAVALVAADTREIAGEALRLMRAEYKPLPVVSSARQARAEGAPPVHAPGNLLKHIYVSKGNIEEGFAESEVIFEDTYFTPAHDHAFLEPECSIARSAADGRLEIYVGSQIAYSDRSQIAASLGVPENDVRVIGTLVGGGFGGKEDIAGQIHAAMLARATGRPVKLLFDRQESLLVHPKRHATEIKVRLGARRDGTLVAAQTELLGDTGAYASLGEKVLTRATTHSAGPYVVPHVRADCYAMYTNNPPAGAFRGFGVLQSNFAVESSMDALARQLGIDPLELRRKNALRLGTRTNTGQLLTESAGLPECIDRMEAELRRLAGPGDPFVPEPVPGRPRRRRSWGIAVGFKNTGLGGGAPDKAGAELELYPDGTVEVRTSSAEIGQGLVTVLQMVAAEELSLPPSRVRVLLSDTDLTPDGGPTTASRQTYVTGNAVRKTAQLLLQSIGQTVAEAFDCPPDEVRYIEGLAQVRERSIGLGEVVGLMRAEGRSPVVRYEYWAPATQPLVGGTDIHFAYSFAAQAAQVEVDLDTGEVQVLRMIVADDVGKAVNPLGLQGQIEGGVIMGVGQTLTEEFIVDEGRVFSDRLARYRMPGILHTPEISAFIVEHPTAEGPYGAKGVGEISIIPTPASITNAVFNACGVRVKRLPIDQDWLAQEIARRER